MNLWIFAPSTHCLQLLPSSPGHICSHTDSLQDQALHFRLFSFVVPWWWNELYGSWGPNNFWEHLFSLSPTYIMLPCLNWSWNSSLKCRAAFVVWGFLRVSFAMQSSNQLNDCKCKYRLMRMIRSLIFSQFSAGFFWVSSLSHHIFLSLCEMFLIS